jgi:hypothetical protein
MARSVVTRIPAAQVLVSCPAQPTSFGPSPARPPSATTRVPSPLVTIFNLVFP